MKVLFWCFIIALLAVGIWIIAPAVAGLFMVWRMKRAIVKDPIVVGRQLDKLLDKCEQREFGFQSRKDGNC